MSDIPKAFKRYFWDVPLEEVDRKKHSKFVIERILEYGDRQAVSWMKDNFQRKEIRKVILSSRNLSKKSFNFWVLAFNLKRKCKKLFPNKQEMIWPY